MADDGMFLARAEAMRSEALPATHAAEEGALPGPHLSPATQKRGTRRDREFRRYAEAVVDLRASIEGEVAASSRDLGLTALAQLVALRLRAKRAMISLFDREKQYVIVEATQTLSLQQDTIHAPCDGLWFGASVWDRVPKDFFWQALKAHETLDDDGIVGRSHFEVCDLRKDARYAKHRFVVNEPFARSFAGVPLITPGGYAIGTVSFFDDQPRKHQLSDAEVTFMRDIASTTMAHIEKTRLVVAHSRSLRMVHGLSRFVEGKTTADDTLDISYQNAEDMANRQNALTSQLGASRRTHAMNAASNAERMDEYRRSQPLFSSAKPRASSASTVESDCAQPKEFRPSAPATCEPEPRLAGGPLETEAPQRPHVFPARPEDASAQPESTPLHPQRDLQEDLLSKDVRKAFERAAVIINTAMNLSGTLFLDASVGEFGRLRGGPSSFNPENDLNDPSRSDADALVSESDMPASGSEERTMTTPCENSLPPSGNCQLHSTKSGSRQQITQTEVPKPCRNLASAYAIPSTKSGKAEVIHLPIPERYLESLLRRFPYGKQWNFDPYGNTSSDEFSDSSVATDASSRDSINRSSGKPNRRNRRLKRTDGHILTELFPGARSLALMPMYDAKRERFFAGAIVWSYDPIRVLTVQDDLNYLGAFCDVIMAEVGRLDAQAETRSKDSFISSMSHELRTPLHGILGGIECLQDKNNAVVKDDMLQMIESSGRSLLDIIDHLLEHANATGPSEGSGSAKKSSNKVIRNRDGSVPKPSKYNADSSHQLPCDLALLTEEVLNTSLWATPEPNLSSEEEQRRIVLADGTTLADNIKVILDIDASVAGDFRVNSGAWRRIVQNLASNALKYTDAGGYMKISLSATPTAGSSMTAVELVCLDSGRGMSQQFLNFGLWEAFSQEDSSSKGIGLGLSLVHGIVKEMGGTIDVQSSLGVGSAIRVRIPLRKRQKATGSSVAEASTGILEQLKTRKCAILGFDEDEGANERSAKASIALKTSILSACETYGVRTLEESDIRRGDGGDVGQSQYPDVIIISEKRALRLSQSGSRDDLATCVRNTQTIVLCHSVASSRVLPDLGDTVMAVAQPLGPRKLLRALTACLKNVQPEGALSVREGPAKGDVTIVQSPLVLTSRPESVPRSSYFGSGASIRTSGLTTLLVDDNNINLTLLRAYMNKHRHAFICASNGLEAVNAYRNSFSNSGLVLPTVIFMDLTMPVLSGLEATRQIRAFERANAISPTSMIIALTAMNSSEARQEAFGSGVDHFMTKPVRLSALQVMLEKHIEERKIVGSSE